MTLQSLKRGGLEDPGHDLLDRVTGFWGRFGRVVLIGVGALAVAGVLAFFTLRARAAAEDAAAGRLAEASVLFWQGSYDRSLETAKQIIQQYGSTPSGIDASRLAGDDAFWSGDFKGAIGHYRDYLKKNRRGILANAVRRSLAYALESDGVYPEAATTYAGLVGVFDRESSAEFLMAAARCYRAMGQPAEAVKSLQRLVDDFGETSYATLAREKLAEAQAASR